MVLLLLHHHADVTVINGEGRTPLQMTDNQDVKKLIEGTNFVFLLYALQYTPGIQCT